MRHGNGFSLIEVLVSLALMALMGLMGWRGLDILFRTREVTQLRIDSVALAQVSLGQWRADLNAQIALPGLLGANSLAWNGSVLRILRRISPPLPDGSDAGLQVVAWTLREGHWRRWQSPALRSRAAIEQAWVLTEQWGQTPSPDMLRQEVKLMPVKAWQLFYFRENAWTNPLSSAGTDSLSKSLKAPDGVRLILLLNTTDNLTIDWIRETFNPGSP